MSGGSWRPRSTPWMASSAPSPAFGRARLKTDRQCAIGRGRVRLGPVSVGGSRGGSSRFATSSLRLLCGYAVSTPVETTRARRPIVAIVLAAGRSERPREVPGGGSKALVRVGGMALVERAVRTLLASGIDRVVVITGYHAGPVGAVAGRSGDGRLHAVYAEDWEMGNGASLAAAERTLEGAASFLVVAADHVFSEGAFRHLLSASAPACLIDPSPSSEAWDEGTRVLIRDGRARAFGKELDEPVIDCGAFLLTLAVFEAHREAVARGDATLAGAITALAARQPLT